MREKVATVNRAGIVRYTNNPSTAQFHDMPIWKCTNSYGIVAYFIGDTMYQLSPREYMAACQFGAFVPLKKKPVKQRMQHPAQQRAPRNAVTQHHAVQQRPQQQRTTKMTYDVASELSQQRQAPASRQVNREQYYQSEHGTQTRYMQKYRDARSGAIAYGADNVSFDFDDFADVPSPTISDGASTLVPDKTAGFEASYLDQTTFFDNVEAPHFNTDILEADDESTGIKQAVKASVTGAFQAIRNIPQTVMRTRDTRKTQASR